MKEASKLLLYLYAIAFIVLVWELLALYFGPFILPTPWEVFLYFVRQLDNPIFLSHLLYSLGRLVGGLAIGFILAFPLGIALGYFKTLDKYVAPIVFLTYPIPKVLFLPVLLVLFGLGEAPKLLIIALTTSYLILVVTRDSIRAIDPNYYTFFATLWPAEINRRGLSWFMAILRHVLYPQALPAAITAFRLASGTAVAVLFIAESFATDKGLGFLIVDAWGAMDLRRMWSGILAMSLIGAIIFEVANLLEYLLCPWKRRQGA
ncbi:MAG: ABC transporter permease [Deltaproteobacteria bacterium]|nr:ABC transporter permease [Deltaproteobacteria bacterium]